MQCVMSLLVMGTVMIYSCKKKDDAKPNPSANTVSKSFLGTDTTINVLASDSYTGGATVSASNTSHGTVVVNSDQTIKYTPKTNFYGTDSITYSLKDDNGSSSGLLILKRGTDAQIKTVNILNKYVSTNILFLYAIDGDTASAAVYASNYGAYEINYTSFSSNQLIITSNNVMPVVGSNTYSIVGDGTVHVTADNSTPVFFTVLDYFTATDAKKHDGSGNMTVTGYSIQYGTHKLDYTTRVQ